MQQLSDMKPQQTDHLREVDITIISSLTEFKPQFTKIMNPVPVSMSKIAFVWQIMVLLLLYY